MKRIHFLLLGLLVSLTIAAVSPTQPPTRLSGTGGIAIITNGVNSFTISGSGAGNPATNLVVRQSSGNALTVNTNVLVVATNYVGINNTAPLAPLHVGNANVAGPVDTKVLVAATIDNTGAGNSHAFSDTSQIARSGGIGYNSFYANANIGGGVDYDHYAAFQSFVSSLSVGTMKNYYGHYDALSLTSGTVKTNTAFHANRAFVFGGNVEINYGLYVDEHTNGTVGNFAVYTAGTTPSTFGGAVKVGNFQMASTASAAADVGIYRYGAGLLMVSDGGASNRRDLMLRELWDSGGNKVVGSRQAAVADAAATAGTATLAGWGFLTQAEFDDHIAAVNALKDQLNDLLAKLRTHGLIAP